MSGDRESPDRDFICQSDPRNDCVVPASTSGAPTYSDVHFYFHGAGAETKYTGSIDVGFFEGSPASHVVRPEIAVKKTESIANHSVLGLVTSKPGRYAVTFDLVATVVESAKSQPVRTEVPVTVRQ